MTQPRRPQIPNRRRLLWLLVWGVVGGLLVTGVGYYGLAFWMETGPAQSQVCCETPADWGFSDYQDVRLASHGETLAGWYIPSRNRAAVILLHPGGIHRMGTANEAKALARAGFGVLLYDRRAYGESTGEVSSYGWLDAQDVPTAVDFLRHQPEVDGSKIGIFGASLGGQVALRAAARWPEDLQAVWADGPSFVGVADIPPHPTSWWKGLGHRLEGTLYTALMRVRTGMVTPRAVVEVIGGIAPTPLVLVATEATEQRVVRRYFEHANEPKELWVIPEATHGTGWQARPAEYPRRFLDFFAENLEVEIMPLKPSGSAEEVESGLSTPPG